MAAEDLVIITVAFSVRARETIERTLLLPKGCTAGAALASCAPQLGLDSQQLNRLQLGVWGKKVAPSYVLQPNDRLEIYRALAVDPKVARRERFAQQGTRSKVPGLFARRRAGAKPGY